MKLTKRFTFDTPISKATYIKPITSKVIAYARISGLTYWNDADKEWDNDYANFDIESVRLLMDGKEEDALITYRICKMLSDDFAEQIDKAVMAHSEYLFFPPIETGTPEADHTDTVQDEQKYGVVAIAGTGEQLLQP